jgi:DUF1680 family protein
MGDHGRNNIFRVRAQRTLAAFVIATIVPPLRADDLAGTHRSPHAAVHPLRLDEVRWTEGFWADRFAACRDRSLPAMWDLMRGTKYKPYLQHFLIAAGDIDGEYHGAQWNDGDFYKFLEAVCAVYAVTRDAQLAAILDESIDAISRAQRSDGYLHTPMLIRARNGDTRDQPFQDRNHFEMYNMGHLMTAACLHQQVTGSDRFLAVARKTADYLYEAFRAPTPELARNAVCPSHYMGLVDLFRTTGEPRYRELATKLFAMRSLVADGGDDNQDRIPFSEQREAVGHAVRANYLYAGAADLYLETGDIGLRSPLEAIWRNVTEKKMYITGGCGALYDGASPDGSSEQSQITRVHQAYGRNYQLPNVTAHNETCAAVGNVLWNWRMFLLSGDARYIDVLELALYNAVLSGVSLEGTDYFYVNPLRQVNPLPANLRWSRTRVPFVTSYCCPPNVLRTIAEVNGFAYAITDDAVWVNLYGSNRLSTILDGEQLQVTQQTSYPWEGGVRLTVDACPKSEFSIRLRIPGWATNATIRINGADLDSEATPGTFADIRRQWNPGDVLSLELAMLVQLMEAHPLVEETRNQIAIQRGPIVYCLESPDLPDGAPVADVMIPNRARFTTRYDADLLDGVTVIEAGVAARAAGDWNGKLYRPLQDSRERQIKARFIPYYAWSNRGPSEMSVWLPAKRSP